MQERARQLGPLGIGQVRHGFPVVAHWEEREPALLRTDKRADVMASMQNWLIGSLWNQCMRRSIDQ